MGAEALALPIPDSVRTACFAAWAETHPGVLLEDKIYVLSLHYRLAPEARPKHLDRGAGKAAGQLLNSWRKISP